MNVPARHEFKVLGKHRSPLTPQKLAEVAGSCTQPALAFFGMRVVTTVERQGCQEADGAIPWRTVTRQEHLEWLRQEIEKRNAQQTGSLV